MVTALSTRRSRQIPVADQLRRAAELDSIRLQRRLTPREQAEADNLADRAYHRHWRALQRQQEAMLANRIAGQGARTIGGAT